MKISQSAVARAIWSTFHTLPCGNGPLLGANSPYSGCNAPVFVKMTGKSPASKCQIKSQGFFASIALHL